MSQSVLVADIDEFHYGDPTGTPKEQWITLDPRGKPTWYHAWPLVAFCLSVDRGF